MKTNMRLTAMVAMAFTLIQITLQCAEDPNQLPPVEWAQIAQVQPKPWMMTTPKPGTAAKPDAPPTPPKEKPVSWWTDFSISPYVAWRNVDFTGKPIFGAGIGFGYQINRAVGLHLLNTLYDEPDVLTYDRRGNAFVQKHGWTSGTGIDETEVMARADLIQLGGKGNDRFVGFLLGSYTHSWEHDDEAIGVGAGYDIRLSKNFAFEMSYRVRAFFNGGDEGCGMAGLHFQW